MKKLIKTIKISGVAEVLTGLSIGGTNDGFGIASQDNPIIRDSLTNNPIIPGSSLKGSIRFRLEQSGFAKGIISGEPCGCGREDCLVCKLFGAHKNTKGLIGFPRLKFSDCFLTDEFANRDDIVEVKTETMIDRNTGTAKKSSLRTRERITAGTKFNYSIILSVYEGDNEVEMIKLLQKGLRLTEIYGLGGKTSSGYGKITFNIGDENYKFEILNKDYQFEDYKSA